MLAAMREIKGDAKKRRYIDKMAMELVSAAAEGDLQAMKEVGDRLDGRPKQAVDMKHDASDPMQALWAAISNKSHVGQKDE